MAAINVNSYVGSRYDPNFATNQQLGGDVNAYAGSRYVPKFSENQRLAGLMDPVQTREQNIAAAKAAGTFDATVQDYNQRNEAAKSGFAMTPEGEIVDGNKPVASPTASRLDGLLSESLSDATRAKMVAVAANDVAKQAQQRERAEMKAAKDAEKAAKAAEQNSPQAVSQRLSGLFGVQPAAPVVPSRLVGLGWDAFIAS